MKSGELLSGGSLDRLRANSSLIDSLIAYPLRRRVVENVALTGHGAQLRSLETLHK